MRRYLLLTSVAALGILAGCGPKANEVTGVGPEAREAISQATMARYPGRAMTSPEVQVAAINYDKKHYIELHNLGTSSIPPSTVWVNGTFVTNIAGIPPKSYATVQHGALLEAGPATNDLRKLEQPVAKVEIQTDKGLFTVQGPTIK
jgi:hypothetical protein